MTLQGIVGTSPHIIPLTPILSPSPPEPSLCYLYFLENTRKQYKRTDILLISQGREPTTVTSICMDICRHPVMRCTSTSEAIVSYSCPEEHCELELEQCTRSAFFLHAFWFPCNSVLNPGLREISWLVYGGCFGFSYQESPRPDQSFLFLLFL